MPIHSPTLSALYAAALLPLAILYLLVFITFLDKRTSYSKMKYAVSARDAAIATLALDISALSDVFYSGFAEFSGNPAVHVVLIAATFAHLAAMQLIKRKSSDISHALERMQHEKFATRLSSLYIATILLLTNGTTLLAVLELVRTSR